MSTTASRAWKPVDIGVAGPTPADMARAFWSIRADPLSYLGRARERWGDVVAFPVPGAPVLLISNPADVRRVLQTGARHWGKQTVQYAALARVTGPGLLASADPSWIAHRRLAAPAFHHHRLDAVGDQVRAAADAALASWDATQRPADAGAPVDVAPLMLRIALDAVGRALFSTDLTGQSRQLLDASSRAAQLVVKLGRAIVPVPLWSPTPTNLRLRAARRRLDTISAGLIAQRRASEPTGGTSGEDLLGLLVDSDLSDGEIRDELVTMIIAGHETVGAALAWTLMLLAEHQPAQDQVRAELAAHPGPVGLLDHRSALPWTRAVIDEALRLFPPAWALSRRSDRSDVIGGYPVPAGTTVIVSPWLLHRDRERWPDPLTFRPERFLGELAGRPGYLPFGQGPRLCIGREFALGEMVVVLGRLLSAYHVAVPPGWARPRPEAQVAVHPDGGMRLVLTPVAGAYRMTTAVLAVVLLGIGLAARDLVGDLRSVPRAVPPPRAPAAVSVVVPARNEAAALPTLLRSLHRLTTEPAEIVVVDDDSQDATASVAHAEGATVLSLDGPPAGWTGKAWACQRGADAATGDLLVFLDADTELAPDALAGLLELHERYGGLVSVQPFHDARRPYEQLSAYFNLVSLLASGAFGRHPERRPMAFGPCLVTSRVDYEHAGGHAAVRSEVLDDVQLAAAYHRAGLPVRCLVGAGAIRMRMYPAGVRQLAEGWTKNVASGAAAAAPGPTLAAVLWVGAHHAVAVGAAVAMVEAVTGRSTHLASGSPGVWAVAWLAAAWQLRSLLHGIGSFRWWTWALFPVPLLAFDVLFARSAVRTVVRRSVRWRGRDVHLSAHGSPTEDA